MKPPVNSFKQRLQSGEDLFGLWMSLASPVAAEALSESGCDWLLFDTEHAPVEVAGVLPLLQASAAGSAAAIVRPAWNDKVLIKRLLDLGAQTLLIPFVQDVTEAQAAVAAMRYPPSGIRGVAGATRASRFGRAENYLQTAEAELCCIVQIETREALGRLEEIAAVEGVDGVFIGPSDLAASLGHLGDTDHRDVQRALFDASDRLNAIGKPAGILATSEYTARRYRDWGYRFIAAGSDLGLLVAAADGRLTEARVANSD